MATEKENPSPKPSLIMVDVRKDDIEIVKKVLQQVYDNLNP